MGAPCRESRLGSGPHPGAPDSRRPGARKRWTPVAAPPQASRHAHPPPTAVADGGAGVHASFLVAMKLAHEAAHRAAIPWLRAAG